jgi:predicted nuclease with TOPRIM domain
MTGWEVVRELEIELSRVRFARDKYYEELSRLEKIYQDLFEKVELLIAQNQCYRQKVGIIPSCSVDVLHANISATKPTES